MGVPLKSLLEPQTCLPCFPAVRDEQCPLPQALTVMYYQAATPEATTNQPWTETLETAKINLSSFQWIVLGVLLQSSRAD